MVADARAMLGLDGVTYVGNHGLEIWTDHGPEVPPEARPWVPRVARVVDDLRQQIHLPGVIVENKGPTASIHYRLTDNPEAARQDLLELIVKRSFASGLRL